MLPTTPRERKAIPLATGVLDYFPRALAAVAEVSHAGNEQHHPGTPLHWDKSKSTDEADALMRHFIERGKIDMDGQRHSAKVAWRALALLERELESAPKRRYLSTYTDNSEHSPFDKSVAQAHDRMVGGFMFEHAAVTDDPDWCPLLGLFN